MVGMACTPAVTHLLLRRRIYDSQAEVWPLQLVMEQDSVWQECSVFLLNGECGDAAGEPRIHFVIAFSLFTY